MSQGKDFEEFWRRYVNAVGLAENEDRLMECLKVATTLDQMSQVFHASFNTVSTTQVRPRALKKMLDVVKNIEEAKRVYALASKTGKNGYYFPARVKEAEAKLKSFSQPA